MKGKKTGGRVAGTPNKVTRTVREWISTFVESNLSQIEQDLKILDPKDRIAAFEKLLQYILPKLQAVEANIHDDGPTYDYSKLTDEELLSLYRLLPKISNNKPEDFINQSN